MGQKFAAYNAQGAIIGFYDSFDSPLPSGVEAIEITDAEWQTCLTSQLPYTVENGALTAPTAAQLAAQQAPQAIASSVSSAFATGLEIISSSMPSVNGTYAIDQLSQMDIIAIETSLNAGKGFPGGGATFNYPDTSGTMHAFSETNFTDFAAAVRDYVYALKSVIAGASTTLPSNSTTIA